MMNSEYDDDFAPNPFRSGQQQQNQQWMPVPGTMSQPDPYSGMTGTMDIPESLSQGGRGNVGQPGLQQPPPLQDPTQWSGAMDQRARPIENYGSPTGPPGVNGPSGGMMPRFGWRSCVSCFSIESYIQYFDLETHDVVERLKASVFTFTIPDHFRTAVVGDVPSDVLKGPDLYGPVWLSFTLIFLIAVTSNIHAYWTYKRSDELVDEFEFDINLLMHASTVVLTFVFCVSSAFWLGTSCMGMPGISWAMWVCCYGYCQVPYMLASVLIAVLPFELVSWCVLGAATGASNLLVLRNLSTPLLAQDSAGQAKAAPFILAILAAHTIYFLFIKVMFYP